MKKSTIAQRGWKRVGERAKKKRSRLFYLNVYVYFWTHLQYHGGMRCEGYYTVSNDRAFGLYLNMKKYQQQQKKKSFFLLKGRHTIEHR